jgi:hypothetical protein
MVAEDEEMFALFSGKVSEDGVQKHKLDANPYLELELGFEQSRALP